MMDILHKYQKIMNPITETKLNNLINLLNLKKGSHVLDIGCGKGELLIKLAEKYRIKGIGLDKSPYCINDSNKTKLKRVPDLDLTFYLMDGADYQPNIKFNLTSCVGATWIFGDYLGTLKALSSMTQKDGLILVGEPYWLKEPDPEYLKTEGITREKYRSHYENVKTGEQLGLRCLYTLASDLDGWDYYETLHWWAAEDYAANNPDDPDVKDLLLTNEKNKEIYLRWRRETIGWCLYLFKKR